MEETKGMVTSFAGWVGQKGFECSEEEGSSKKAKVKSSARGVGKSKE